MLWERFRNRVLISALFEDKPPMTELEEGAKLAYQYLRDCMEEHDWRALTTACREPLNSMLPAAMEDVPQFLRLKEIIGVSRF